MTTKKKAVSVLKSVKGRKNNIETTVDTLDNFFEILRFNY